MNILATVSGLHGGSIVPGDWRHDVQLQGSTVDGSHDKSQPQAVPGKQNSGTCNSFFVEIIIELKEMSILCVIKNNLAF